MCFWPLFRLAIQILNFAWSCVSIACMNHLKKYADQVKYISDEMKSGQMTLAQGAVQLQAVATLAEQDAGQVGNEQYAQRLRKFAEMIYALIEKMNPERRVIQ